MKTKPRAALLAACLTACSSRPIVIYPAKLVPAAAEDVYRCNLPGGVVLRVRGQDVDKVILEVPGNPAVQSTDCWLYPMEVMQ